MVILKEVKVKNVMLMLRGTKEFAVRMIRVILYEKGVVLTKSHGQ